MTRRDDFDDTLSAWLRGSAPHEAPDRVLETVLQRMRDTPQRRGWWPGMREGTLMTTILRSGAVAAVLVLATLVGLNLFNRAPRGVGDAPASPAPTATGATPSLAASTTPSQTTTPSGTPTAANGQLVLRLQILGDIHPPIPVPQFNLSADGRVITMPSPESGEQDWIERGLTHEGVELVRSWAIDTGVFEQDGEYLPQPLEDTQPPGRGSGLYVLTLQREGRAVTVMSVPIAPDEALYFERSPEREALEELVQDLLSLETSLPAEGWQDMEGRPYVADEFLLLSAPFGELLPPESSSPVDVDDVSWPGGPLESFGEATGVPGRRCGTIDRAAAERIIDQIVSGGDPNRGSITRTSSSFILRRERMNETRQVTIVPLMPDGFPSCADIER